MPRITITIGPVDSGQLQCDTELRTYLAAEGFCDTAAGKEWVKHFLTGISADAAVDAFNLRLEQLAVEHSIPSEMLPRLVLF